MKNKNLALLERTEIPEPLSDETINTIVSKDKEDSVLETVKRLGYIPPSIRKKASEVERAREEQQKPSLPLAAVLRTAGIKPFTLESVEKYQKAMLKRSFAVFNGDMPIRVELFIAIVGLAINCTVANYFWTVGGPLIPLLATILWVAMPPIKTRLDRAIIMIGEFLSMGSMIWITLLWNDREWKLFTLKDYKKDIPRPVLETVAEIHARCPRAEFYVEELAEKPDPFLLVTYNTERYYVEVWLEPKFNGIRAV